MKFRPDLADLPPYIPGKLIPGVLKMASNENPLGPSPRGIQALSAAAEKLQIYPDGSAQALREALATHLSVGKDQILLGNGSDEVLSLIALAILSPGDEVITSESTFSEYEFSARLAGARALKTPLKDFTYDLAGIQAQINPRTKIIFLCNPNNPTGTWFTHQALEDFLLACPKEILVVLDEAYIQYADQRDLPRSLELLAKFENLLILRTFSKIYGLAALRVGFAVAHPSVIQGITVVKQPFNLGTLGQVGALAALGDQEFLEKSFKVNQEGREFLTQELSRRGLRVLPTQANFLAFHVKTDAKQVFNLMAEEGVTIRPMGSFGLPDWVRVTIGTQEHNEKFLRALDAALSKIFGT